MKKLIIATAFFMAAGTLCGYAQQNKDTPGSATAKTAVNTKKPAKQYTCSMHPDVVQSKPGKCPECGMKLVAAKAKKK